MKDTEMEFDKKRHELEEFFKKEKLLHQLIEFENMFRNSDNN